MKSFSIIFTLLFVSVILSVSHARVSKSFVRGFLVGYAKGLEEGKNLVQLQPMVHSVACAFHPLPESEPEMHVPHHEPHHMGDHEPHHHSHHSHHHEHGYSASSSHASNAAAGQGLSSSNIAASHVPPPQVTNNNVGVTGTMPDEKKAAASTNVIEKTVKQPYKA